MSNKAQDPVNYTHRCLVAARAGSVTGCYSGFALLAVADIHTFYCCGNLGFLAQNWI